MHLQANFFHKMEPNLSLQSSTGATQIHAEMMAFAMILMMIIVVDVQQDFWAKTVKVAIQCMLLVNKLSPHLYSSF